MPIADLGRVISPPGESSRPLGDILGVDDQPEVEKRLREDLEAVRDAERRAEHETKSIRLD